MATYSSTSVLSLEEQYGKYFLGLLSPGTREQAYSNLASMEQDFPEAGIVVGQHYQGIEARKHFSVAADAGLAEGHWGVCSTIPHSHIPDPLNSNDVLWEAHCLSAAEGECADACNEMGNICNRRNWYAESAYWYTLAASYEHPQGGISMQGISQKWVAAGRPEEFKGTKNFTQSRYESGLAVLRILAGNRDPWDEHRLMKLALDGNDMAGLLLAFMYEDRDDAMAYQAYNVVSFNNNAHSIKCQGDLLYTGKGTERDVNGAFRMYKMAAELANAPAMFIMGELARNEGNKYLAAYWYGKAYVRGYQPAAQRLNQLVS